MERAGNEDMSDDVERKGLGTPATRADIIEKLVKDGFVKREKKQMLPTEDGMKLITVLPDVVKSSKLTADWENALTLVAKVEMEREDFMADIETMVSDLIHTYHEVSDEQKKMFAQEQKVLGKCPNCGGEVVKGKYGAFCKNKCGMNVSRIMGVSLSDEQVESLLDGKKTLLKGITSKAGKKYDAYIIPSGTEEYHYTKDGEEKSGAQFKFVMEFPNKKFAGKKKYKEDVTMGAEETKKVQDNESKADKFVRLGEYRVNKVIDAIGRLENLSNRTNYEYTQEQVEAMFSIMEKRLLEVKGRFAPKKEKEDTFSFGRKAE